MSSVLHLIRKIRDQHSSCTALFLTPISNSIKSYKMETESKSASHHSKNLFFVNIKSVSTKDVNLSTKRHRHILKGQSKNEKLLKTILWNRTETLFRNQVWNIYKIYSLIYCLFLNTNTKISTLQQNIVIAVLHHWF